MIDELTPTRQTSVSHALGAFFFFSLTNPHTLSNPNNREVSQERSHCLFIGPLLFFFADRQEGPPGDHLGGGLRGPPAEAAEGQTDAEGDGRVCPREVRASSSLRMWQRTEERNIARNGYMHAETEERLKLFVPVYKRPTPLH